MVPADDVQAQVDACGGARAGQHVAIVDVQHGGIQLDRWVVPGQFAGVVPVRGRRAAVEQARGGEDERAGAQRDDTGAAQVRSLDRGDQLRGRLLVDVADGGDDYRIGACEGVVAVRI